MNNSRLRFWTEDMEALFAGFLFSRYLLKARLPASNEVAKAFGLETCSELFWKDCSHALSILTKGFGIEAGDIDPAACARRLRTMKRKGSLGSAYNLWRKRFDGDRVVRSVPELFKDGVFEKDVIYIKQRLLQSLRKMINQPPFLIRKPIEPILSLMNTNSKPNSWTYEDNILLVGIVAERFTLKGSMYPERKPGCKPTVEQNVWRMILSQFDVARKVLAEITDTSQKSITPRTAQAISVHYKRLRMIESNCSNRGIHFFLLDLNEDFRYINKSNLFGGNLAASIDLAEEKHRIKTFLALRKSHGANYPKSNEFF